ncbi:hypothetical protein F2P56_035251 [Juglans regia]|uniref:Uncharacterized protein n=1 Tax=Juglans regia TaxID=51240 RepID=A0A833T8M9_JUGRE|nr:hypothetical protein F2P56_035251 [Juglans regia]
MAEFRAVMQDCVLIDLGLKGPKFSWSNGMENNQCMSERLDKFVANMKWCASFPMMGVEHVPVAHSDHLTIIMKRLDDNYQVKGQKLFRFKAMFVESAACKQVIDTTWKGVMGPQDLSSVMKKIQRKIQRCAEKLMLWNKSNFGNVKKNIEKARHKLKCLYNYDPQGLK